MKPASYTASQIAAVTGGKLLEGSKDNTFDYIVFDSRKTAFPSRSLFFAMRSGRHDGHSFIPELFKKGVKTFVVTDEMDTAAYPGAAFIKVTDSVNALQRLAAFHRDQFDLKVIGITGSNGKTIVKEWLYQLLSADHKIVRSPLSYNSQIGVPLSIWQITPEHTLGIFEAGISQPGEMEKLRNVIKPSVGIITNIGHAHDEGFLNIRQKVNEKLNLFIKCDVIIYCKDYGDINEAIQGIRERRRENIKVLAWSKHASADLAIRKTERKENETRIEAVYEGKPAAVTIPFTDSASIENAIHCWALMLYLGYKEKTVNERMAGLTRVAMRLELKKAVGNCSFINDSYNSDLESLKVALDFLAHQSGHANRVVILSDILQSGLPDSELYEDVARLFQEKKINMLVGIGESITGQRKKFDNLDGMETLFYKSTEDFLKDNVIDGFRDQTILLKGARQFRFERIGRMLEEKIHDTVLEINLDAITHNLHVYQSMLKKGTRVMAMVKAFSYGSGSHEIAGILQFNRVDYLAVAYADEGIELRKAGITLPVMVMSPEQGSFEKMISHRLEPEIYSLDLYRSFEAVLMEEYAGTSIIPYPVHIKLDTGMHRLGFGEKELNELAELLGINPLITIRSIFSHLVAAGDPAHDDFTREQAERFRKMSDSLMKAIPYKPWLHLLNSAGVVRFPEHQLDMVRLGLGLYGIDPTGKVQKKLKNVSRLKTKVSQVKIVPAGETIGYGRNFRADKPVTIATVNIGYADGLSRRLGNGVGKMIVRGREAPIIGNVCMDMTMIDISAIKNVRRGDEVIVFGDEISIARLAELAGTIPYEVLTNISKRVKRVYYQE